MAEGSAPDTPPKPDDANSALAGDSLLDPQSIDDLLKQANFEDPSAAGAGAAPEMAPVPADALKAAAAALGGDSAADALAGAGAFSLPDLQQVMRDAQASSIELLRDVELNVKIELGRSRMLVEDVLKLSEGSVVELDKLAGDPVDVFVNDRLVARGEVLVLNDNFCVRVNEIVAGVKEETA